jgi:hypothetical protein
MMALTKRLERSFADRSSDLSGPIRPSGWPFAACNSSDDSGPPTGLASGGRSCSAQVMAVAKIATPRPRITANSWTSPSTTPAAELLLRVRRDIFHRLGNRKRPSFANLARSLHRALRNSRPATFVRCNPNDSESDGDETSGPVSLVNGPMDFPGI